MNPLSSLSSELEAGLDALALPRALAPRLLDYLALLARWNQAYNLTAIRDPREMLSKHLLDSLAMADFVDDERLADLGTGPGLPGIPLAIARPGLQVALVESNGKKARFLREAVRTLGLAKAQVVAERVWSRMFEGIWSGGSLTICSLRGSSAEAARSSARISPGVRASCDSGSM